MPVNEPLQTGQHVRLPGVLPLPKLQRLRRLADLHLNRPGDRPLRLADQAALGASPEERYRAAGVQALLAAARPWLDATIGPRWLVLAGKVLLRRTWPLEESEARALGHNANNLVWHQDSNSRHGHRPMVVLMTTLQDGSGSVVPGLTLLEAPVRQFEGMFGYEGARVDKFKRQMAQQFGELRTVTPVLSAGELLLFDGLTFHRTVSNAAMDGPRDGFLVRVVRPEDAAHFEAGPHLLMG
jgi:hypothetical protein